MSKQFKNKGGASETDPNPIVRWLISTLMSRLFTPQRLQHKREIAEARRKKAGAPHRIEYFHQMDDGYSHLAAQTLKPLLERYDVELVCHLVVAAGDDNQPEPQLLQKLSCRDAYLVAPQYGLEFPKKYDELSPDIVDKALSILAAQDAKCFVECVANVGSAMWEGDMGKLDQLAKLHGAVSSVGIGQKLTQGTRRRSDLKHYSGAMFYYAGEWYWGVDRLYHLEKRLAALGLDKTPNKHLLTERPTIIKGTKKNAGKLTLEVFPSLRSPYTAISFDRVVALAHETGVKLVVRPVLPMVMRGVPATREKGMYIFMDAAREAYAEGIAYGRFSDPIGEPARKAYSLFPWAREQGKDAQFISSFLRSAFALGINTNREKGLKSVVEQAGLDWQQAKAHLGKPGWEEELEANRLVMYQAGLWGVPSFRLLGKNDEQLTAVWGQDRLWLLAQEIQHHLAKQ